MRFDLPEQIRPLIKARNKLKAHYSDIDLRFTLDGNLVGDLGEAVAASLFGLKLTGRANEGVDGHVGQLKVQVKASGTGRGAAFRDVTTHADHLLFFHLDFENCRGEVIYNGPEELVRSEALQGSWNGQRSISAATFRRLDKRVDELSLYRLPKLLQNNRD